MSGPLAHPPFRLLAAGRAIDVLGNAMAPIALAFAVLDLGGSVSALGLVVAARYATMLLFLLLGGVVADRLPRFAVLVGSNALSAAEPGRGRRARPLRLGDDRVAGRARRLQRPRQRVRAARDLRDHPADRAGAPAAARQCGARARDELGDDRRHVARRHPRRRGRAGLGAGGRRRELRARGRLLRVRARRGRAAGAGVALGAARAARGLDGVPLADLGLDSRRRIRVRQRGVARGDPDPRSRGRRRHRRTARMGLRARRAGDRLRGRARSSRCASGCGSCSSSGSRAWRSRQRCRSRSPPLRSRGC